MIVGVDFSTKEIHLVRRRDGETWAESRTLKMTSAMGLAERDAILAREAASLLLSDPGWWDDVWLAGVEYPFTMRLGPAVGLKTIMGAIVASIPAHVHVIPLPGRLWQPIFCQRRGKAYGEPPMPAKSVERKPLIRARALELLRIHDTVPQDVYDAFGLSWTVEILNLPALDRATG